jgi:NDP-sugar pyrophosphorylase family protein
MSEDIIVYISAGGQSTRLYPLTLDLTKAWLDIGNKTPLLLALRQIADKIPNLDIFILLQGFLNNTFIPIELRDGSTIGNGARVNYVHFYDPRKPYEERIRDGGSGEGFINFLETSEKIIGNRLILVMNVDNLANFNPKDMAEFHRRVHKGPGVTIGVTYLGVRSNISQFGTVKFDEDGKVIEFREKSPEPASPYINTGIVMFSPGVVENLRGKSLELKDLGGQVLPWLIRQGVSVYAYGQKGEISDWVDFGTIRAYLQTNGNVLLGRYPWFGYEGYEELEDGKLIHKNSKVMDAMKNGLLVLEGHVLIGSNLALYGNDRIVIRDAVIGHNVKLGDGSNILGCSEQDNLYPAVLLDATSVFNTAVKSAIVGYSSSVFGNGRTSTLEPYSVVGNDVTLSGVNLGQGVRVAPIQHAQQILETGRYDLYYSDGKIVYFTERKKSNSNN